MKDKILSYIRKKGPIFPTDISSELGIESYFVSAYLSEMLSKKEIMISYMKIGSSPLYFLPNQKKLLENFSDKLNNKDKIAFNELKEKKVLRDSHLTPLLRVSLKNIKDFAVPLEVSFNNKKELFWKFYSVSPEEVSEKIKNILSNKINDSNKQESNENINLKSENKINLIQNKNESILNDIRKNKDNKDNTLKDKEEIEKLKKEIQKLKQERFLIKKQFQKTEEKDEKNENLNSFNLEQKIKDSKDFLIKKITEFFNEKKIEIVDFEIIKKNSEIDVFIKIPTTIGKTFFICKVKNKKKLTDLDIDLAYASGINYKLPVILLTKGELTKKAKEKLNEMKGMKLINF